MNDKPTHGRIPASSALTETQLDGLACVECGEVFQAGTRSVPVGEVDGAQVFACASHGDEQGLHSVETPDDDDATSGKSATWPQGEPQGVRDMERRLSVARRADDLAAELDREFGDVRDERLAAAVRETIGAFRELSAAGHTADEEMIWRTAVHAHAALTRCALLVAEAERRTR